MTNEKGTTNSGGEFDGTHTLTQADLQAIRLTIFKDPPIEFMDTQKIILENQALKLETERLRGWVSLLTDGIKGKLGIDKN